MTATLTPPAEQQKRKPPFLVRRSPVFYGWVIVGLTFSTSMVTAGISGYGLSFFVVPMSEALGVTRAEFSSITLFRLAAIPLVPLLGMLVDKREGPRLVIVIGSTAAGLSLIASSFVENMWQFYLTFGIFFGIAMMAMGGQLVGPAVLSKWFVRRRARVMAISAIGISGGGFVIAPIAGQLVEQFGWRDAWVILGIGMILIVTPAAALLMRRQPSDVGLMPDGIGTTQPRSDDSSTNDREAFPIGEPYEYPWTVREAARTGAFWALLAAQVLSLGSLMPILFHQVAYMQDKDFSLGDATLAATTLAGFAIVGKIVYGTIVERVHVRLVLAMSMIPAGLSVLLLVGSSSIEMLLAYAVVHGLTMGGFMPLMNVALAQYFGRQHMGSIRGAFTPLANIVGAVSPFAVGWMWEQTGNYDISFMLAGAGWFVGGFVVLLAREPKEPDARSLLTANRSVHDSSN